VTPLLQVTDLDAGYGGVPVLRGVSIEVSAGETVALLGSNGAGKSTLLRAISGLIRPSAGTVTFAGEEITRRAPYQIVRHGLVHVPEGRRLFARQTVASNLELGFFGSGVARADEAARVEAALDLFPALKTRMETYAGLLSGGQQQMLAIAQALVRDPRLLILDEPSLGLAPVLVDEVFAALTELGRRGGTVLIVEQLADRALRLARRAYVMSQGQIAAAGDADTLRGSNALEEAYLGVGAELAHDAGGRT
jgi:branched-chain amino acid transport system ATP-binding protein